MSGRSAIDRYTGVAIGLHWLIATLVIGMLAVGKWMTELELEDPLRFSLTQWHKSFGITILLLSLFRLYWRKTRQPPAASDAGPAWEKKAASITHRLFYVLFFAVPLSGWLLVSASPLNIPTLLFQTIPWPHIPMPDFLASANFFASGGSEPNSPWIAGLFLNLHHFSANLMLVLVLLHIGAALRHHLILKDSTLSRMSLFTASGKLANGLIPLVLILVILCGGLIALNRVAVRTVPVAIAEGEVRFTATLMGNDLVGTFSGSEVEVQINPEQPETGMLNATVSTATLQTGDSQVAATLVEKDWFDIENYPQAQFKSTSLARNDGGDIEVSGMLTIKETSQEINFPVSIERTGEKNLLTGGFVINRLDYQIGAVDQPDDGYAGFNVMIEFVFELGQESTR